jgi:uncharacterized hydrophobic protein (TIGR00271 family)
MLTLRGYVDDAQVEPVVAALEDTDGVSFIWKTPSVNAGETVVFAELAPTAVDPVFERLKEVGVAGDRVAVLHAESTRPTLDDADDDGKPAVADPVVWSAVVDDARESARPVVTYLLFMAVAGVIAAYGILDASSILIVGAMAVSPDLRPLNAAAVGIVGRRLRLTARALATLLIGLGVGSVAAAAITLLMRGVGYQAHTFNIPQAGLMGIVTVDVSTFVIALAAGVASILAMESRASAAVGVAISVTTIPAAAFAGVALASGSVDTAGRALAVLGVNLIALLIGSSVTLWAQSRGSVERFVEVHERQR